MKEIKMIDEAERRLKRLETHYSKLLEEVKTLEKLRKNIMKFENEFKVLKNSLMKISREKEKLEEELKAKDAVISSILKEVSE